jgi:cytochrome c-type biogenesis protein CcmH/NrfG
MKWKENYKPQELGHLMAEAKYHLGRVLCEGEIDFDRAVSELEEAVRRDPENIAAHYYLGRAIREQIERNTYKRAEEVLRTYLMKGAPLGHEDEVREFLGSRKRQETTSR